MASLLRQQPFESRVLLLQLLGPFGRLGVLFGPLLVQPPVPSRFGDLEFLDDLDHRVAVVQHFLALPDLRDDLFRGVSACHDS